MVPTADVLIAAGLQVPLIPLVDVNGRAGAVELRQSEPNGSKVGVICAVTIISNVVAAAHCPASGVKVYVPLAVLLTVAGDHVPDIPLMDVVGNTGAVAPEQNGAIAANVGIIVEVTVISNVVAAAH